MWLRKVEGRGLAYIWNQSFSLSPTAGTATAVYSVTGFRWCLFDIRGKFDRLGVFSGFLTTF